MSSEKYHSREVIIREMLDMLATDRAVCEFEEENFRGVVSADIEAFNALRTIGTPEEQRALARFYLAKVEAYSPEKTQLDLMRYLEYKEMMDEKPSK